MAERTNPFSMSFNLTEANMTVEAILRKKNDAGDFEELDKATFEYSSLHTDLVPFINLYGLSKLIQDRSSEVKAGPEKLSALREVFDQLVAGQREKARVVGAQIVSSEVEALARIKGIDVPSAQLALKKYDKEQRDRILANPKIVELAAAIEAERANAVSVDLTDLAA